MLYKTHISSSLVGAEIIVIGSIYSGFQISNAEILIFILFFLIGSLFPDIDEPNSKISKILPNFISYIINVTFGHRGFTHNILGIVVVAGSISYSFIYFNFKYSLSMSIGFFLGYIFHIFGDLVTYLGIKSFWIFNNYYSKIGIMNNFLVGSIHEYRLYLYFNIFHILFFLCILILDNKTPFL